MDPQTRTAGSTETTKQEKWLYDVQYAIIYKTALVGALPSLSFPHGDCSRLTLSFKTAEQGPMSVHVYIYELKKAFLHFNSDRD